MRYDRSVDVHSSSIRQKLREAGSLIHTIRGTGYQLAKDQASSWDVYIRSSIAVAAMAFSTAIVYS